MLDILLVFSLVFVVIWYWKSSRHPEGFPPGPRAPLPLIGDGYILKGNFIKGFHDLRKKYGDTFGLWMGSHRAVVISDFDDMQELFNRADCSLRSYFDIIPLIRGGLSHDGSCPGVLFSSTHTWVETRRFCLSTLRDFGFGKQALEDIVDEEVDDLIEDISVNHANKPFDIREFFNLYVVAGLWRITSGDRLKKDDPRLKNLITMVRLLTTEQNNPLVNLTMNYPNMFTFVNRLGLVKLLPAFEELRAYAKKIILDHADKGVDSNALDFTEAYLKKISDTSDPQSPFNGEIGYRNLENVMADFFIAGSDTTANALNWAMLFMALHPDIQAKVQQELERVYGRSGKVSNKDRHLTPYTEAVLHEITRRGNILPMSVWHATPYDEVVEYKGFKFPPHTILICMIGEVMLDPKHFPDPLAFNPERFLSEEKDGSLKFTPHPQVVPFGVGKRRCLGEALARVQLYKFFAGIMQNFTVISGQAQPLTDEAESGFVQAPKRYKIMFQPRS